MAAPHRRAEAPRLRPAPVHAARGSPWRALAASFGFAWAGLVETVLRQRNMRLHVVAGSLVAALASAVPLAGVHQLALAACVVAVLSAEVANSGLEALVDLVVRERDDGARRAKDAAAGVVLVVSAGAVLVLAIVASDAWQVIAGARAALARQALAGLPLLVAAGALPLASRWPAWVRGALGAGGCASVALLAVLADPRGRPFVALGAGLLALAASAARRRTSGDVSP